MSKKKSNVVDFKKAANNSITKIIPIFIFYLIEYILTHHIYPSKQ